MDYGNDDDIEIILIDGNYDNDDELMTMMTANVFIYM